MTLEPYGVGEDTLLLLEAIRARRAKVALELGVGSGIVTLELSKESSWVVGCDLDRGALRKTQQRCSGRGNVELVCCDAATAFRQRVFSLIVFNPPYLPSNEPSDLAIDGGREGTEVTLKWVQSARQALRRRGSMIFISSSLSNRRDLLRKIRSFGIEVMPVKTRKLFFEDLIAHEATIVNPAPGHPHQATQESS